MSSAPMTTVPEELIAERAAIADYLRYCAGNYPESSDGRNTFVMAASWVEARTDRSAAISPPIDAGWPDVVMKAVLFRCADCTDAGNDENNCRPANESFVVNGRVVCEDCLDGYGRVTYQRVSDLTAAPHPAPAPIDGRGEAVTKADILREWFGGDRYARDYEYLDANFGNQADRIVAFITARTTHPAPAPGPADAVSEADDTLNEIAAENEAERDDEFNTWQESDTP